MSQPIRLRDGGDVELRELMRYAQAQGAPTAARVDALTARVLAELNAPRSDPASTRAFGAGPAKWLIGVAVILGLGAGVHRWLELERTHEQAPRARGVPAAARSPEPRAAPSPEESAPTPHEARVHAPEPKARGRAKPLASKQAFPSAPAKPADLTAEVTLLQRARRALTAEPEAALALVAQHRREHPAGMFSEEREAIAVEALWRAGDVERASTRLRAMLLAYPRSTYRERLTTLLERPLP